MEMYQMMDVLEEFLRELLPEAIIMRAKIGGRTMMVVDMIRPRDVGPIRELFLEEFGAALHASYCTFCRDGEVLRIGGMYSFALQGDTKRASQRNVRPCY